MTTSIGSVPPPGPLNYTGSRAVTFITETFDPNTTPTTFQVPTIWINYVAKRAFISVAKANGDMTWLEFGNVSGDIGTLTGNSGGAVGPDGSDNVNVVGDGSVITIVGNAGTHTLTAAITGIVPVSNGGTGAATLTNHGLLVGQGTSAIVALGDATNGQLPIGSSGANPVLNTLTAGSGITITNNPGSITISQLATAFVSVVVQTFTTSGTYTPTAGMLYVTVEVAGGGGGGAGASATSVGLVDGGSSGSGGGYSRKTLQASAVGASQTVTIGAGGAGATGGNPGTMGGTTSFGSIFSATGGDGGQQSLGPSSIVGTSSFAGGAGMGGDINVNGSPAGYTFGCFLGDGIILSGTGGSSYFGGGARGVGVVGSSTNGIAGTAYGGGGSAGVSGSSSGSPASAANGGAGSSGVVICTEFIG